MSIKLVDFKDIQDAILEELKIQSSDTVSLARIKRVINEVYINEIIPFARWKWLEGHTKIKFREAYSAATASLTPNSVTVTLSTAPSAALGSFTGYYFASTSLSEIYIIESHTAGSTTITLSSQYLGSLDATATYKIWTDKIPLPTDCRETVTVWHNMYNRPMDAMGWQKLRELSLRSPKAEGYPRYYYTGDYKDPSVDTDELETDRYRELTVYPAIYTQPVTISVDYIKEVSELTDDGDEPVLPLEDRIVIKYGALKTLWRTIGRNPEEAVFSAQEYNEKLARMAGKIEDSHDKPQIHVDSIYMKRRRASRYRVGGYSSDMVGTGGSTTASTSFFQDVILQGGRISADFTVDTGITIDGVDISVLAADFAAHLVDPADAHDASAISSNASGNLAATDVQSALDELQTDIDTRATTTALTDHINDTTAAHAASAIAVTPTGNLAADDVQEALAELQTDVDTRLTASSTATLTNKTFDADGAGNSISNIENADIKAGAAIDASKIADGSVSNTEFQYISTVTSNVQTQLDGKVDESVATTKGDLFVATASATIARQGVGSDGQVLTADSTQTNGLKWADATGGGEGVNFIDNGTAETSNIFSQYNDSSTTRPVDGDGGTASNLASSVSATSPLAGLQSFLLSKTGSASTQGMGWSVPFTIDAAYKAKVLQIEFDYIVNSGTFVAGSSSAESDVIVYLYDVTNSTLIEPSSIKLLSNSTTISDKFVANFQTSATGTSYRLILHCQSTSTANYELKLDNISVKPCTYVYGTPITDWQSYTPTGSWSTNTTYTGRWRRVGDTLEAQINLLLAGAPTAADLTVNFLPAGLSVDSSKMASFSFGSVGDANIIDSGTRVYIANPAFNGGSSVYLVHTESGNTGIVNATNPVTFTSADNIRMNLRFPITGWSSSVQVSDGYDGRQIAFSAYLNSTTTFNNTTIIYDVKTLDKTASYSTSTGTFTAPKAGLVLAVVQGFSATTAIGLLLKKNGSTVARSYQTSTANDDYAHIIKAIEVNAGDTLRIDTDGNYSIYGGAVDSYFEVYYLNSPTTISATEVVAFMAEGASSSSIGSNTTIPFNTPSHDTHAGWNSTNKDWAAPYPGYYQVFFQMRVTSGGTPSVNQYIDAIIQIDAVTKREFVKYVENTGVVGWEANVSWQGWLNAGQKIRAVGDTNITSPVLTTGATHTFLEIFRNK